MAKTIKKAAFLKKLKESKGIISYACEAVNISRKTYYNWRDADPEFKDSADEIIEMVIDLVEAKLLTNINEGDTTSIIFFLKTKGKDRGYTERTDLNVNVNESITEKTIFRVKPNRLEDVTFPEDQKQLK